MTKTKLCAKIHDIVEMERETLSRMEKGVARELSMLRVRIADYERALADRVEPLRATNNFIGVMASMIDAQITAIALQRDLVSGVERIEKEMGN